MFGRFVFFAVLAAVLWLVSYWAGLHDKNDWSWLVMGITVTAATGFSVLAVTALFNMVFNP